MICIHLSRFPFHHPIQKIQKWFLKPPKIVAEVVEDHHKIFQENLNDPYIVPR